MSAWLTIVGIGEDGPDGLAPAARALIASAPILFGDTRHFAKLAPARDGQQRITWTSPLKEATEQVLALRGQPVTVLATGDPMQHGIGATIAGQVPADEVAIVPHVSSFALAAARMVWPMQHVTLLSVHGRPRARFALHIAPGARLLVLAHDGRTPIEISAMLVAHGFGDSRLTALAHLDGALESRVDARAGAWTAEVPALHVLAVECVAGPDARWWPRVAGLPDEAFEHDGKLTKRDLRAAAIARLTPHAGARLWDIGAGCGSVGIEFLRAADHTQAIALEPRADRRAMIAANALALGVPGLDIRDGDAPDALAALPDPDAIFLGGGISAATIDACRARLRPGGRLVAHAVTLESEALLLAAYARQGGTLTRHAIVTAEPIGALTGWRPAMPVTQWALRS